MKNLNRIFFTITILFLLYASVYAQANDVDLGTATYEQIHIYVIGILTYVWGFLAKFIPGIDGSVLPKAVTVAAGGLAVALLALNQGFGSIIDNLMSVLSAMGVYDIIKGFGKKSKTLT